MDGYRHRLNAMEAPTIDAIGDRRGQVTVGGMVCDLKVRTTKKGEQMATGVLEDRTGRIEIVIFPQAYRLAADKLGSDTGVLVTGKPEQDEDRVRLLVFEIDPIDHKGERNERDGRAVRITLGPERQDRGTLEALAEILKLHRGPSPVEIRLLLEKCTPPIRGIWTLKKARVRVSEALLRDIELLCGKGSAVWTPEKRGDPDGRDRRPGDRLGGRTAARAGR